MCVHTKVPFQYYPSRIGPLSTFKGQQSSQSILNFNHGLVEDLKPSSSPSFFELIAAIKEDDAWVKINLNKKYVFEGWFTHFDLLWEILDLSEFAPLLHY